MKFIVRNGMTFILSIKWCLSMESIYMWIFSLGEGYRCKASSHKVRPLWSTTNKKKKSGLRLRKWAFGLGLGLRIWSSNGCPWTSLEEHYTWLGLTCEDSGLSKCGPGLGPTERPKAFGPTWTRQLFLELGWPHNFVLVMVPRVRVTWSE